jgi:ABC-2 type transport system permease protein
MGVFWTLFHNSLQKRIRDGFALGYNIIFPITLIVILGSLLKDNYTEIITSYQYYTLVTIPFCTLLSVITAAYAGKDEAYSNTAVRFLSAPIKKSDIVLSKQLACTIVFAICNIIVLEGGNLIWKLPLRGKFFPIIMLLTAETFFACGVGLFIGFGMKNFIIAKNLINIPICLFAILGGSFFPVGSLNAGWQAVLNISPLTWVNKSIFKYLYDDNVVADRNNLLAITVLFLALGIILIIATIIKFRKEEYLDGDLPSYKK